MNFWRRVAPSRLLDIAAFGMAGLGLLQLGKLLPDAMRRIDFAHYYASSRLAREGHNPYRTALEPIFAQYAFVYDPLIPVTTNPPALVWLFVPFAMLPVPVAYCLWVGVQLAGLAVILWLTRRLLGGRLSASGWRFAAAAALISGPVQWNFVFSQVQLPLAALVLAAFYWRRRGWECLACVAITVAGLIKLYPLVLLPWFVWRGGGGGRGLAQRIGVCAAVAVAGWLVTGPAWWRDFVVVSTPVIRQCMITDPTVFSVPSLVAKYCGDAAAQATGLVVIGLAYAWCARRHGSDEREFSLLCVAMLVAGWVTWAHYLVFLIFPFTLLVIWVLAEPSAGRLTWAAVLWVLLNDNEQGLERLAELLFNCRWPVFALPLAGLAGVGAFFALRIRGTSSDGDRGVTTAAETRKPVGDGA